MALQDKLGHLVADAEVLAGELHHLVRSRRQRARVAFRAAHRGGVVGSDFYARLGAARRSADELVRLIQLGLQRRSVEVALQTRQAVEAASLHASALKAVRRELPQLPPNIFNRWDDPELPAARLYTVVIKSDSTTCAAVGAHGQGGVGKTLSCLLVAHRIAEEADGRRRFPDGVHWVQLSQDSAVGDVKQRVCDLATSLSGQHVVANELDVAVGYLRATLQAKSCLLIVDDVWDDQWAATFISAVRTSAGSCLLFSTRRVDIAARTGVSTSVLVDMREGASATGVLLVHAEAGGTTWADKTDELVQRAVSVCGGLALALVVMGSLVRERGWVSAVDLVHQQRDALPSKSLPVEANYQLSLRACLLASYRALGVGVDAAEQQLWHARFQALCVVRPKEQLPRDALAALWGEDDPEVVRQIGRTLQDRSLVTLRGDEADGTLSLSLHDLVIEFLSYPGLMSQVQREEVHIKMVAKYCERNRIGDSTWTPAPAGASCVTVRKLWELPSDGYVELALPRLLCAGGALGRLELLALLFHWRFVAWRVKVGNGSCTVYRTDALVNDTMCVDGLDRVATVIEGALVYPDRSALSERLQQAAWEVWERFARLPHAADGEAEARLMPLLVSTARSYLQKPTIELYGASRLRLPQERRVFGCNSGVRSVCSTVNPDGGACFIAGLASGKLKCWEERSGKCAEVWDGHTGPVTCTVVVDGGGSNGGGRVVSGSTDRTLRVWDVSRAKCVTELHGHTREVECLVVLDSGESDGAGRVVSGSLDMTVRVWDLSSGECIAVLRGHADAVMCLAVLDGGGGYGGGRVVSASADHCVRVWNVNRGTCTAVLEGHVGLVGCLAVLTGDGSLGTGWIVSASHDRSVRVWDDSGKCLAALTGHEDRVVCLAALDGCESGGRRRVVSGSADRTLRVWDVVSGVCIAVLEGHTGPVLGVRALYRSRNCGAPQVVSGSADYTVRVWDVDRGLCAAVLHGHTEWVRCLVVLDRGGSGGGRSSSGWSGGGVSSVGVSSGGDSSGGLVVSGSHDHTMRVWEADSGEHLTVLERCSGLVGCLAFLHDDGSSGAAGRVVSGSADHSVRVWEVDSGQCVAILNGHTSLSSLAVLHGGGCHGRGRVVTGSRDHFVRVWDVDSEQCLAVLSGHTREVECLAVLDGGADDGSACVVSGSHDRSMRVWDLSSGRCVSVLSGHTGAVMCLAALGGGGRDGGLRVVSGSRDQRVRVWDLSSGACVAELHGHTDWVMCLAVLEGGGRDGGPLVVSGSKDRTMRVWDLDVGRCVAVVQCRTSPVTCFGTAVVDGARPATLSRGPLPLGVRAAADSGAPSWAGGCFLLDQRCRCAFVDIRCDAGRWSAQLRYVPAPPGASAMCGVSPSVLAWGTKDGHVYFGRRTDPPA